MMSNSNYFISQEYCISDSSAEAEPDLIVDFAHRRKSYKPNPKTKTKKSCDSCFVLNKTEPKSELIVDFAHRRTSFKPKEKRHVRFKTNCSFRFYEGYDMNESSELFFTQKEEETMREARYRAVADVNVRHETLMAHANAMNLWQFDDASEEEFGSSSLVGVENLLTPEIFEKSMRCRQECRRAVLEEQARQVRSGRRNPERLAQVSMQHSRWSTKRSRKIGLVHHEPYHNGDQYKQRQLSGSS